MKRLILILVVILKGINLEAKTPATRTVEVRGKIRSNFIARISEACTSDEHWDLGAWVPKKMREDHSKPPSGENDVIRILGEAYNLKLNPKLNRNRPELQLLADYMIFRSYYELKLYHFAERGFQSIVSQAVAAPTLEISLAALGCLNQVYHDHPTMAITFKAPPSLEKLDSRYMSKRERTGFIQGIFSIARAKLSQRSKNMNVSLELALLKGSGPYEDFITLLEAGERGDDDQLFQSAKRLLSYKKLPDLIKKQMDGVHLNVARVYYNRGAYDASIREFKKVSQTSSYFSNSIADMAWAQLMLKNYSGAVSSGFNFRVGALKNDFAPDPIIVLAISLYENCHYQDALDNVKLFNKKYNRTYRQLYDWYYQQRSAPIDYYSILLKYLSKKASGVPMNLALEWLRSPRFIAQQDEINLLFDESHAANQLVMSVTKRAGGAKKNERVFLLNLRNALLALIKSVPRVQQKLIMRINAELLWRNYAMIGSLVESFENSQLLEAEVLRAMGENVLNKQQHIDYEDKVKKSVSKKKPADLVPLLSWGEFSSDDKADPEIWNDEIGKIETDVTNICPKK